MKLQMYGKMTLKPTTDSTRVQLRDGDRIVCRSLRWDDARLIMLAVNNMSEDEQGRWIPNQRVSARTRTSDV